MRQSQRSRDLAEADLPALEVPVETFVERADLPSVREDPRARELEPLRQGARLRGLLQLRDHLRHRLLRIAEEHAGLRIEIQIVVDPREAGLHRTLDDDDVLRLIDVE